MEQRLQGSDDRAPLLLPDGPRAPCLSVPHGGLPMAEEESEELGKVRGEHALHKRVLLPGRLQLLADRLKHPRPEQLEETVVVLSAIGRVEGFSEEHEGRVRSLLSHHLVKVPHLPTLARQRLHQSLHPAPQLSLPCLSSAGTCRPSLLGVPVLVLLALQRKRGGVQRCCCRRLGKSDELSQHVLNRLLQCLQAVEDLQAASDLPQLLPQHGIQQRLLRLGPDHLLALVQPLPSLVHLLYPRQVTSADAGPDLREAGGSMSEVLHSDGVALGLHGYQVSAHPARQLSDPDHRSQNLCCCLDATELNSLAPHRFERLPDGGLDGPQRPLQPPDPRAHLVHQLLQVLGLRHLLDQPPVMRHHLLVQLLLQNRDTLPEVRQVIGDCVLSHRPSHEVLGVEVWPHELAERVVSCCPHHRR
mmetsp:Transcript_13721/g.47545  ORF Transcript_13721/g.47545 Transcript_13721/m.47545 type:complete len:416 (-) Transcript_13721:41-1288(-)